MPDSLQGPEPTGWELLRGLNSLREEVSKVGGRVVSMEVYTADKRGVDERFGRAEERIRELETERAAAVKDRDAAAVASEKQRRQNQFAIALAVVGPILGFILTRLTGGI